MAIPLPFFFSLLNCKGLAFPQEQHVSISNGPFLPGLFNAHTVGRREAAWFGRGDVRGTMKDEI